MTQNFNLSEKRIETCEDYRYREVDVKLFIKLLKEELRLKQKQIDNYLKLMKEKGVLDRIDIREQTILKVIPISISNKIDSLAGSALAGEKK